MKRTDGTWTITSESEHPWYVFRVEHADGYAERFTYDAAMPLPMIYEAMQRDIRDLKERYEHGQHERTPSSQSVEAP